MVGIGPSYTALLLPILVTVVWYCDFARGRRLTIFALLALIWMLGWAFFAISQRGVF